MKIEVADWTRDQNAISAIRRAVFIEEQSVPEALEWDGLDAGAIHLLAREGGTAVGTARMLADGHIGRMSVLKAYRGQGIGRRLLLRLLELAREAGLREVQLDAQTHAIGFYEQVGFIPEGDSFLDAGIPHRHMRLRL